ncbi:MAG TPA: hypothetical protein VK152_00625, partial [Paludibacter sp.]|nr:hypothetical protein [Paludibacter sp.]
MVLTILGFGENLREELLLLTLFFCSSICVLYFVCEFFVLFSRRREAKIQQTRSTIQSLIVESVFDEERLEENITALKELNTHAGVKSMSKRRRYFLRQLMMDEMLLIKKNISGTGLTTLYELYKGMRLYDDSFRKINSRYYHYIVLGLRELSEMNYADCQPVITSLVNHKNRDVRIEAQLAMVRLWGSEGLKFLSTIEYDISEWQQMTMLQLLHTETQRPAGIQEWLSSPHESVIVFALRLLEKYNCFDLIDDLYGLFNHRSEKVRIQ